MNIAEYAIVSDFDGTITSEDSNVLLIKIYGNERNMQLEQDFIAGKIGTREAMLLHFETLPFTLDAYYSFLDANVEISPGFDAFLQKVRNDGADFYIVSGGFAPAVKRVLGEERLMDIHVFANDLRGEKYLQPFFFHASPKCTESRGPCGNCKKESIDTIRQQTGKKIIFIGDGLTDRCAVEKADITFAKGTLAGYCQSNGYDYVPFEDFQDIMNYLSERGENI